MDGEENFYDVDALVEWSPTGQLCRSGEALAEWRSCEQVDNGTPSTSPPYWDSDDDNDGEFKPSELYGKYTWKIDNFSQLSKKELKSEVFEVNGYKWYILIYPQGCDVSNHLSLFLCVANHTHLLPGWGHFAQFTLAVVNKDRKKTKYSDTLHRFCKKEHDWGWKKFIELSKVQDGFLIDDTLKIKAQVQIIRKKAYRPFRCLDRQYRRELLGVYLANVEQVCRKFVEDQKGKLRKLLKEKARWSSFCTFWLGMDPSMKQQLSQERADVLFKVVVKHFFVEKEVTSALVMDSLYSGLRALRTENNRRGKQNVSESMESLKPIVYVDGDMFVLANDLLKLLEKKSRKAAARQSLSAKDFNRYCQLKAGTSGQEFNTDSIEWEERRLTEIGRRTIEIFVLSHIFSQKIEVAYQEAVAARIQEELIREEEESREAEQEQRAKRQAADKEKILKKKLNKQKRNARNGKDQRTDEKDDLTMINDHEKYNDLNAMGPSRKSLLSVAAMSRLSDNGPNLRDDNDYDDENCNWITAEDIDTSPVTEDRSISETCLSGETSISEQGLPYLNGSFSSRSTDAAQLLEMNGWHEEEFSDNGSWSVSVRKKNQRPKVTSGQIKQSTEICNASANGLRSKDVPSKSSRSVDSQSKPERSLKDHAQKVQHIGKIEHVIVQEDPERSRLQFSVPEVFKAPVQPLNLTSVIHPKVRQNGIHIRSSVRTEAPHIMQASIEGRSTEKYNGDGSKQKMVKATLKPSSTLKTVSGPPTTAPVDHVPKKMAAAVSILQTHPSPQFPSQIASSSSVSQLLDSINMPKPLADSMPTSLPPSNGSLADSTVALSLTAATVLPLDDSANDLVTGLTFGSLTPEVLLGQPHQASQANSCQKMQEVNWSDDSPAHDDFVVRSTESTASSIGQLSVSSPLSQAPSSPVSQTPRILLDDFPHIDIINYLFEEDAESFEALNMSHHRATDTGSSSNRGLHEWPIFSYSSRFETTSGPLDTYINRQPDANMQGELSDLTNGYVN